ncbi:MAG: pitrilysin family protein [Rhizomicrobium sp.]|jgi:zinc protease
MIARHALRACAGIGLFAVLAATPAHAVDVQTLSAPKSEQIWYVSDHTLPMIAMTAAIPAGSAYDPQGKDGLAAFAASLLDEGAGRLNSNAFHTALANRAIRLSVTPERDYLLVQLVTLTDNARDAFRLLGQALAKPRFDADAIQRVRAQMLSTLQQEDEDPATVANKAFFHAYFHDHPYAHPIDGTAATIAAIGAGDLKSFAAAHWVNSGLKISVSGDVDPAMLNQLLKSAFGGLPTKAPAQPAMATHVGQPGVQVVAMDVPQPTVIFAMPGFLRADRDFLAGYVANYIVGGGGFSSRLTDQVREQRGLTYDISTSLDDYRHAGILFGQVATKRGSVRQMMDVVRATLRDFAANGPTDKELVDAKTYLTGSFPLAFSSNVDTAGQLNSFQRSGLSVDYLQKRNALIGAVTIDDVKRAARRLFNPNAMTVVVAGSLGEGGPAPKTSIPQRPAAKGSAPAAVVGGPVHSQPRK